MLLKSTGSLHTSSFREQEIDNSYGNMERLFRAEPCVGNQDAYTELESHGKVFGDATIKAS